MIKNLTICFFAFMILFGCGQKKEQPLSPIDLFETVEKIEGSVITELPCVPSVSIIFDSLLIVVTAYCDYHFAIINLNTAEIIKKFGRHGKGPGEYFGGNLVGRIEATRYFQTFDTFKKMHTYNLDSLLAFEGYLPTRKMDNLLLGDFMNIARLSDSLYVGLGTFEHGMIGVIRNNQFENAVMNFPIKKEFEVFPAHLLGIAYQGDIRTHPDKQMFCVGIRRGSIFQVYSFKNNKIEKVHELIFELPDIAHIRESGAQTLAVDSDTQWGYMNISVTGEYIFALYSGRVVKGMVNPFNSTNLLVFDWSGNPVKHFILDQGIARITVDQNKRYGYAVNKNAELVKFNFSF